LATHALLFVATLALWVRSHFDSDGLVWWRWNRHGSLYASKGRLIWGVSIQDEKLREYAGDETYFSWSLGELVEPTSQLFAAPGVRFAGFQYWVFWNGPALDRELIIPLWFLAGSAAVLPGVWTRRFLLKRRRRKLRDRSCCTDCGYDLRATPERCPECGAVPT